MTVFAKQLDNNVGRGRSDQKALARLHSLGSLTLTLLRCRVRRVAHVRVRSAELLDVAKQLYSEQFSEQTLKCASTLKNI